MRTWEMIKELTENPNKVFARVGDGRKFKASKKIENGTLVDHYASELANHISSECILLKDDWELIPQEVTWQEAIESFINGKDIYCEVNGKTHKMVNNDESFSFHRQAYKTGKWFIK